MHRTEHEKKLVLHPSQPQMHSEIFDEFAHGLYVEISSAGLQWNDRTNFVMPCIPCESMSMLDAGESHEVYLSQFAG